ncbi:MAG: sigma-54-dependent Fis family transcriptional regulator [Deltaproteobacteria bacterium]|nr:sigma-54-dependent Fis family transcriptional regulator [Deltaproteobacteria bacterium]
MKEVFSIMEKVADCDCTVMINGKTGTGKGLIAKAIHRNSQRKNKPFISINCGAIPEDLLESELFGHTKGSFTGAIASRQGKFQQANGGTVFLDEIGDMSRDLQVKVLRVLEEGEFEQVGGTKTIKADVRIISATHRDLEEEVQKGNFRQDLFYRLFVIPVTVPPLRERKSDIPLLIQYFLKKSNLKNKREIKKISKDAKDLMIHYLWPGNVRELKNIVERIVVLKGKGVILPEDLPKRLKAVKSTATQEPEDMERGICLSSAVTEYEKVLILQSLEKTAWVKNRAAKLLHLNRTTLVEKIKRHQLQQMSA